MGRMKDLYLQQLEDAEPEQPDEGDCTELCSHCMFYHVPTHECVKEKTDEPT